MRIIIASTIVPFVRGGGTAIVFDLTRAFQERGHEVEQVLIPFHPSQETMTEQMLGLRLLDLEASADLLVAIRTPSYVVEHPNKVVWFIHHHRASFDLWPTGYRDLPLDRDGLQQRIHLFDADNWHLRRARRLFANSTVTADRLRRFNGLDAEVLYPPLGDDSGFRCDSWGDYVFYPSRLVHIKRQVLLVEAMSQVQTDVRLVIAGNDDDHYRPTLDGIAAQLGVGSRVIFTGPVHGADKAALISAARLLALPSYSENFGNVVIEAMAAGRPVVVSQDVGLAPVVEESQAGLVVNGEPETLAAAIARVIDDPSSAAAMGDRGRALVQQRYSWGVVAKQMEALYASVIGAPGGRS